MGIGNLDEYLSKNPKGFEKDVTDTFYTRMHLIEEKLAAAFPRRAGLLKTIFALHAANTYDASIPMALSQADGMCKETFSVLGKNGKIVPVGFFDMDRNKSEISSQKLSKSFELPETSIFNILYNQLSRVDRNSSLVLEGNTTRLSDLNRHAILHGESINYGNEINSIKAILLLDFIEDLRIMDQVLKEK